MSKAEDILDKTKRGEPEAKKWKVVVGIVVGLVLACVFFGGIFWFSDVDGYLQDSKQIINLYDFYEENQNLTNSVLFIGSSQVGRAIYTPEINAILSERGYDIVSYNLFLDSDTPNPRMAEIQYIIDSSPSLIIYGISYRDFFDFPSYGGYYTNERFGLVHNRLMVRDDSKSLFTEEILEDIEDEYSFMYYKKFIRNAFEYSLSSYKKSIDYSIDGYDVNHRISVGGSAKPNTIEEQIINRSPGYWWSEVNPESDNRKALDYMINLLLENEIPVLVIGMPLHPLLSSEISETSQNNYSNIVSTYGSSFINYEDYFYDDIYFSDSYHVSHVGALQFAPVMADLIIQEMS